MIDRFGRDIAVVQNSDGSKNYSTGGITLRSTADVAEVINSFNAMAPESFILRATQLQTDFLANEFLNLFTDNEKDALFASENIIVRRCLAEILSMSLISVTDQITIDFLTYASAIGLLTASRATFILSGRSS
jgi:hypothetical protein